MEKKTEKKNYHSHSKYLSDNSKKSISKELCKNLLVCCKIEVLFFDYIGNI